MTPPDLRNDLWRPKTRMMGLSDGERISMILSAVLIQYTRVTDGRTELAWHIRAIAYMLSHVKTRTVTLFSAKWSKNYLYFIHSLLAVRTDTLCLTVGQGYQLHNHYFISPFLCWEYYILVLYQVIYVKRNPFSRRALVFCITCQFLEVTLWTVGNCWSRCPPSPNQQCQHIEWQS